MSALPVDQAFPTITFCAGEQLVGLLRGEPEINAGFSEGVAVAFEGDATEILELVVDDVELAAEGNEPGRCRWSWTPGFFAGTVVGEVRTRSARAGLRFRLDVSPDPSKLGDTTFRQILDDLLRHDASLLIGQESARLALGELPQGDDPIVAFMRLRDAAPRVLAAYARVARRPLVAMRPRRERVPLQALRRADLRTLVQASRNPQLVHALGGGHDAATDSDASKLRVDVPYREEHLDHPATRCLVMALLGLRRRARDLEVRLRQLADQEQDEDALETPIGPRLPRWSAWLARADQDFARLLDRAPFSEVTRPESSAAGLNALSAHPLYAAAWRAAWRALARGVRAEAALDALPLSPTFSLYERWCFVALREALERALGGVDFVAVPPRDTRSDRCVEAIADGIRYRLHLQQRYRCTDGAPRTEPWSISRERVPDLVLEVSRGEREAFLVLDAKYKARRGRLLDAMSTAHVYRDALRQGSRRPTCAFLLAPSLSEVSWLASPAYRAEHRVGAFAVLPGDGSVDLLAQDLVRAAKEALGDAL